MEKQFVRPGGQDSKSSFWWRFTLLTRIKLAATMTGYALVCWHCLHHTEAAHAHAPLTPHTDRLALAPALARTPAPAVAASPTPVAAAPIASAPLAAPPAPPTAAPVAEAALDNVHGMQRALDAVIGDRTVEFATASDTIDPSSLALLEEIAALVTRAPVRWHLEVSGHTDDVGNPVVNVDMSARRAAAVAHFLAAHGISYRRMRTIGRGAERPLADNGTPEGRARNRRIEFKVIRPRR
jgi:outer membrane protein OmpA-like peptidoglycan-associated protein